MASLKPVSSVSTGWIRPASLEFERTKYRLTPFDLIMRYPPYQKRILFYEKVADYEEFVSLLRSSLSEVLVIFHPLAGRMRSGDGVSAPLLELDCSEEIDMSVKFTEAQTETTLRELSSDYGFQPCEFCESLCNIGSPPPKFPWGIEFPLLFIQVTRFGCGGVSVGVGFSHQAADGVAAWEFINAWAEISRTGSTSVSLPMVYYGYKPSLDTDEEMFQLSAEAGVPVLKEKPSEVAQSADSFHGKGEADLKTKLLKLSKAAMEQLKVEAGVTKDGKRYSTYVVLCADFWRKFTAARALTSDSNFVVLVNNRGKFVPKSYFGNAVSSLVVHARAQELVDKPLSYAASLLHEAIANYGKKQAEAVTLVLCWVLDAPSERMQLISLEPYMMVVSSPRHPVYESDFGSGRPVGCTFGNNDLHHGKLYLFPSAAGDGGVDATVVLRQPDFDRLNALDGAKTVTVT